jgi:hypothetical protein
VSRWNWGIVGVIIDWVCVAVLKGMHATNLQQIRSGRDKCNQLFIRGMIRGSNINYSENCPPHDSSSKSVLVARYFLEKIIVPKKPLSNYCASLKNHWTITVPKKRCLIRLTITEEICQQIGQIDCMQMKRRKGRKNLTVWMHLVLIFLVRGILGN